MVLTDIPDIDIDLQNRDDLLSRLPHVPASIFRDNTIERHKSGVYFQAVPVDHISGLCALDYKAAEQKGFVKLDLLHNGIYKKVKNQAHLKRIVEIPPQWDLLEHKIVVEKLFQLHGHFNVVKQMKPTSIEELAMTLAIIRPGKRHLIGRTWDQLRKEIWEKSNEGYQFKKSHAFAYALAIVVQLNLLVEELNAE